MKGASFRISIQFHVDALYLQAAPRLCLTKLPNGHAFKEQFIDFLQSFTTAFGDTEKGENNGHESRDAEYEANLGPERRVRLIYEIGDAEGDGKLDDDVEYGAHRIRLVSESRSGDFGRDYV